MRGRTPSIGAALAAILLICVAACAAFRPARTVSSSSSPGPGLGAVSAPGPARTAVLVHDTIEWEGRARTYMALVPDAAGAEGIVLGLHGSGGTGARLRGLLPRGFEAEAARRGLIVAYPDGFEGHWNGCRASAPYRANTLEVDDPGFLGAVVRRLAERYGATPRVGVIGFSNGGHMALRLALEAAGFAEGVVVVGATLPVPDASDCVESREAERILLIAGTADPVSPYGGGRVRLPDGRDFGPVLSARATARYFAGLAGAADPPSPTVLVDAASGSGPFAERWEWSAASAPQVVLLTLHGGGHTIPGSEAAWPTWVGAVEARLDAGRLALDFLFGADPAAGDPGWPAN